MTIDSEYGEHRDQKIASFFEKVRQDSGLQGQILGEVAQAAPEIITKIAGQHGFTFSSEDLKQLLTDRAVRSVQGEVFWNQLLARVLGDVDANNVRRPFVQIKGPDWVNQSPYRKSISSIPERTVMSLSDLYSEIESEIR
jgi:predicted ribosomally synthesized peptide with nif11-like leader